MTHRRTRMLIAVPSVALIAVSLVGCGNAVKDAVKNKVEDDLKSQGVDANLDDIENGNIEIDTTDGGVTTGKLPKTFPTDDVAIVDGKILGGQYTKNPATWTVVIQVGDAGGDKAGAYSTAEEKLTGGGAETVTEKVDNGTAITGQYATDTYLVTLAVTDSNGIDVSYTVSPK